MFSSFICSTFVVDVVTDPPVITIPGPQTDPDAVTYVPASVPANDKRLKWTLADMKTEDKQTRIAVQTAMRQRKLRRKVAEERAELAA